MLGCELEWVQIPIRLLPMVDATSRRVLMQTVKAGNLSLPVIDPLGDRGTLVY